MPQTRTCAHTHSYITHIHIYAHSHTRYTYMHTCTCAQHSYRTRICTHTVCTYTQTHTQHMIHAHSHTTHTRAHTRTDPCAPPSLRQVLPPGTDGAQTTGPPFADSPQALGPTCDSRELGQAGNGRGSARSPASLRWRHGSVPGPSPVQPQGLGAGQQPSPLSCVGQASVHAQPGLTPGKSANSVVM